jgi:hypothetical protein
MPDTTELINHYFELAVAPDREPYFALFSADAVVEDEGQLHEGIDAIRAWRTTVPSVTYAPLSIERSGGEQIARTEIAGDFPGSPVTLTFHFVFTDDGHIRSLAARA